MTNALGKITAWAVFDIKDTYLPDIFPTKREAVWCKIEDRLGGWTCSCPCHRGK